MAVAVVIELPGVTQADYDRVMTHLGLGSPGVAETQPWPEGIISHIAGATDAGWCVVDTWASKEAFERFFAERLGAAMAAAGLAGEPRIIDVELYNTHAGS